MARTLGEAVFRVRPDMRGFGPEVSRGVDGKLRDANGRFVKQSGTAGRLAGKGYSSNFSSGIKGILTGAAVLGVLQKSVQFLKGAYTEARESQRVTALTQSVIKATGGAANVTAAQIGKLSMSLSNKTAIDDETIQSGANMLLTFKNLRNETGKGNDVFNQSTKTLIDMSAALGNDPKTAAIQLGKALNDPVKGISALSRVGVTFNEKQKATIKSMVATGDTLGAQKLILKELNSEFGGAAASQATAGQKAAVAWSNLQETVGGAIMPLLDKVFSKLSGSVIPAISQFVGWLTKGAGPANFFAGAMRVVSTVVAAVGHFIGGELVPFIKELVGRFRDAMGGTDGFKRSLANMQPFIRVVVAILRGLWNVIKEIARVAIPIIVNQFKLLAKILGFVGRAAIWLWNNGIGPVLKFILKGISLVLNVIGHMLKALGKVPGFGWAKTAGKNMIEASKGARRLADTIKDIPKNPKIKVATPGASAAAAALAGIDGLIRRLPKNPVIHAAVKVAVSAAVSAGTGRHAAAGGLAYRGEPMTVGEFGREIFVPRTDGRIISSASSRAARSPERGGGVSSTRSFNATVDGSAMARMMAELFAGGLTLKVGDEEFDAHLERKTDGRIGDHRKFDDSLARLS